MTGAGAEWLDSNIELAGTPEEAGAHHADALQKELHTCLPGIIKDFDPSKQTATVQPAIKRTFPGDDPIDLPPCVDVPVVFPAGGNFVFTFPVAAGDECLLVFSERAIDFWWDRGGTQEPSEYRLHHLSDAFALVGVSSKPRFLSPGISTTATELRTRDGSTKLSLTGDTLTVVAQHVNVQCADAVVTASSVDLGAGSLVPLTDGVVVAQGVDTFTGATYGVLGSASTVVKAKKS